MEKKIKSAVELAMEQTAELKEHHREGLADEFEPYYKAASVLADSFLKGQSVAEKIAETISRYPEGARKMATEILLSRTISGMELSHLTGVADLYSRFRGEQENELLEEGKKIALQYHEKQQELQNMAEQGVYESELLWPLHRMGINGSALDGVNLERSSWWQEQLRNLAREFQAPLDRLKERLLSAIKEGEAG